MAFSEGLLPISRHYQDTQLQFYGYPSLHQTFRTKEITSEISVSITKKFQNRIVDESFELNDSLVGMTGQQHALLTVCSCSFWMLPYRKTSRRSARRSLMQTSLNEPT